MPSELEHAEQAIHNIEALKYLLEKGEFCDWSATVAFYTALHIVEAVFYIDTSHSRDRHGQNHENRERILKATRSYSKIYEHYRQLQSASVIARYLRNDQVVFSEYMSAETVKEKLIKHHLKQLILSAGKFLSDGSAGLLQNSFDKNFH